MVLTDELFQRAGPHPRSERAGRVAVCLFLLVEKSGHSAASGRGINSILAAACHPVERAALPAAVAEQWSSTGGGRISGFTLAIFHLRAGGGRIVLEPTNRYDAGLASGSIDL